MRIRSSRLLKALLTTLIVAVQPVAATAQTRVIIDTHAHLDNPGRSRDFRPSIDAAIKRMDEVGVTRSILMPPPQAPNRPSWELEDLRYARETYPGRFVLLGGGGSLNLMIHSTPPEAVTEEIRAKFRATAEKLLADGAAGFGEIAALHLSKARMGDKHPYENVQPDHPLLLLLSDIAATHGVPIDLHLDFVPEDMPGSDRASFNKATMPAVLKANLPALERLLDHNPKAKIIWAHAGTDSLFTRTVPAQGQLLERHPNLYMSLRLGSGGRPPVFVIDEQQKIKPVWLRQLQRFPDRFVLGSDFFHHTAGGRQRGPNEDEYENYGRLLEQLPPALAEAIGHGNAERLFGLKPD